MRVFILILLIQIAKSTNAQKSTDLARTAANQYIQEVVGNVIFAKHFRYVRPKKERVLFSSNIHLSARLGKYRTHLYKIMDDKKALQTIEIYTDSLNRVYWTDSEWYGYKNTLQGYKKYFSNEFKYTFKDAISLVSDSLRSKNMDLKLKCDCKISQNDSRYNPQVLQGKIGKEITIPFCYEISDQSYADYSDLGWWAKKPMKRIYLLDPNTGYIISGMAQIREVVR